VGSGGIGGTGGSVCGLKFNPHTHTHTNACAQRDEPEEKLLRSEIPVAVYYEKARLI
jgi:hypothetical protein